MLPSSPPPSSQSSPMSLPPTSISTLTSTLTLGFIGTLCKIFTYGFSRSSVHGWEEFHSLLERRRIPGERERGLITVSNHVSIIDDPLLWAFLPYRYMTHPSNMRWSLGSYDLCYKNKALGSFFFAGQVLPTHRLKFSPLGGPFQPTIREAIRLLSSPTTPFSPPSSSSQEPHPSHPTSDPFSSPSSLSQHTYTTNNHDIWPSPSSSPTNRHGWVHIFPEGRVHQHPQKTMRYFRWGVARLILEADVCPDIVPMWIEGFQDVYHESRGWPRPVPRLGRELGVWIGRNVAGASAGASAGAGGEGLGVFDALRMQWRELVLRETKGQGLPSDSLGDLPVSLQTGREAVELRMLTTRVVRDAVLQVRRQRGLGDEDPKAGLVETWREEGGGAETGMKDDGSFVGDG